MANFTDLERNYDNVFLRDIIVGTQSFLFDKIKYKQLENNLWKEYNVPFYYSYTGSEDFIQDYFLPYHRNCNNLKLDGNVVPIPSGILTIGTTTIKSDELTNNHERYVYNKKIVNDFGSEIRSYSARVLWMPILVNFNVSIKTSSDMMRMKIWQNIIRTLYKAQKFQISFEGFSSIPCYIVISDDYDMEKEFQFSSLEGNRRPEIKFQIEVHTYLPDEDTSTEFHTEEKMTNGIISNINIDNNLEDTVIKDS